MIKQQVFYIHGGMVLDKYEDYLDLLKNIELKNIDNKDNVKKWNKTLKNDLGNSFQFFSPEMPCSLNAKYEEWKIWFEKYFPFLKDEIILIGFSLGAIFFVKYLSENKFPRKIKSLHLVAPPYADKNTVNLSNFAIKKSLSNIEKQVININIYYSRDDKLVSLKEFEVYDKFFINAKKFLFEDRGHFQMEYFPELINEIKIN